jgi:uncharacterized protein YuzE
MAKIKLGNFLNMVPQLLAIPQHQFWSSYDEAADTLYLSFKKPSHADDSELTDDNVLIRYEKGQVIGVTILNASKRKTPRR